MPKFLFPREKFQKKRQTSLSRKTSTVQLSNVPPQVNNIHPSPNASPVSEIFTDNILSQPSVNGDHNSTTTLHPQQSPEHQDFTSSPYVVKNCSENKSDNVLSYVQSTESSDSRSFSSSLLLTTVPNASSTAPNVSTHSNIIMHSESSYTPDFGTHSASLFFEHLSDANGEDFVNLSVPSHSSLDPIPDSTQLDNMFEDIDVAINSTSLAQADTISDESDSAIPSPATLPSPPSLSETEHLPSRSASLSSSTSALRLPLLQLSDLSSSFSLEGYHIASPISSVSPPSIRNEKEPHATSQTPNTISPRYGRRLFQISSNVINQSENIESSSTLSIFPKQEGTSALALLLGLSPHTKNPLRSPFHTLCQDKCPYYTPTSMSFPQISIDNIFIISVPQFCHFFTKHSHSIMKAYASRPQSPQMPLLTPDELTMSYPEENLIPIVHLNADSCIQQSTTEFSFSFFEANICTVVSLPLCSADTSDTDITFSVPFPKTNWLTPSSPLIPFKLFANIFRFSPQDLHLHLTLSESFSTLYHLPRKVCCVVNPYSINSYSVHHQSVGSLVLVPFSKSSTQSFEESSQHSDEHNSPTDQNDSSSLSESSSESEIDLDDSGSDVTTNSTSLSIYKALTQSSSLHPPHKIPSKTRKSKSQTHDISASKYSHRSNASTIRHNSSQPASLLGSSLEFRIGLVLGCHPSSPEQDLLSAPPYPIPSLLVLWVNPWKSPSALSSPSLSVSASQADNIIPLWSACTLPDNIIQNWISTGSIDRKDFIVHQSLDPNLPPGPFPGFSTANSYSFSAIPKPSLSYFCTCISQRESQLPSHTKPPLNRKFGQIDFIYSKTPSLLPSDNIADIFCNLLAHTPAQIFVSVLWNLMISHPATRFLSNLPQFDTVCFILF